MEEDLAMKWEALSLTEKEQGVVVISHSSKERMVQQGQHCLLAMVIAERAVNKKAFKNTIAKVWKCTSWMQFSKVGSNQYLVEFHLEQDLEQVLQGRPWCFDRWLVCLHSFDGKKSVKEIPFSMEIFWVQAHNTPFASMNIDVGQQIGNSIGKCLEVQADTRGICWGEFIRMKVELDITKPIQRGLFLTIEGKKSWIVLKYERLPNLCFRCGCIKHNAKGCSVNNTCSEMR
ncbi:uncharacterized protein LOC122296766 [Carya illinoinensis]|uniref:uncharacterized protein LOC122296766 n=1 Tax=Carya illinoinensis TaxID=32201 RepID=UPI001C71F3DB|nr:uncharacterized protein LOC122296766 [Carya illinoinensis]